MGKSYREPQRYNRERRIHSVETTKRPKRVPDLEVLAQLNEEDGFGENWRRDALTYMDIHDIDRH